MDLILDTNIYRNLTRGLSTRDIEHLGNAIIQKCRESDIKILFPIYSAMELIAHYNDAHDKEREECRASLQLLIQLSVTKAKGNYHADFIPGLNGILERYVDDHADTHSKVYGKVINIALMLTGMLSPDPQEKMNEYVETIKNQIEFEKKEIRDNYEDYLKSINNGEADWTYFNDDNKKKERQKFFSKLKNGTYSFLVAQSIFDRAHNLTGKAIIKDQEYLDKLINFMQTFCPALLMNELLLQQIGHGTQAIKDVADGRWNTIIDISLIFGALYNTQGIDRRLVTEEKNILAAFDACGTKEKIINLHDLKAIFKL